MPAVAFLFVVRHGYAACKVIIAFPSNALCEAPSELS